MIYGKYGNRRVLIETDEINLKVQNTEYYNKAYNKIGHTLPEVSFRSTKLRFLRYSVKWTEPVDIPESKTLTLEVGTNNSLELQLFSNECAHTRL